MEQPVCSKCRKKHSRCKCKCGKCENDFFDGRFNGKLPNGTVRLKMDHNGDNICSDCFECQNCKVNRGSMKTDRRPRSGEKFVRGQKRHLWKKWYCPSEDCQSAMNRDPWVLTDKAMKERRKNKTEDVNFVNGPGFNRIVELDPKTKSLMCPELFGLSQEDTVYTNFRTRNMFYSMFYKVVLKGGISNSGRPSTGLFEYFSDTIANINEIKLARYERGLREFNDRIERYPDEAHKHAPVYHPTSKDIHLMDLMSISQNSARSAGFPRSNNIEIDDLQYHFNASIVYYSRRISKGLPIDGFQYKLKLMMQKWWDMGLYPDECKDYLDISNEYIREQLTREIRINPDTINDNSSNNNNNEEGVQEQGGSDEDDSFSEDSDCVICFESFPGELIKLLPCGHSMYCKQCSVLISKCALCRVLITGRVQV